MLRATVWTVGLFGAGTAICRAFPSTWTEPLVLFGLGLALLFVSARTARETRAPAGARGGDLDAAGVRLGGDDVHRRPVATVTQVSSSTAAAAAPIAAAAAAAAAVQIEGTA